MAAAAAAGRAVIGEGHTTVELCVTPVGFRALPKSCEELRHAISCVLTVLKEAHAKGVWHRDLRWPNVLKRSPHQWVGDRLRDGPQSGRD